MASEGGDSHGRDPETAAVHPQEGDVTQASSSGSEPTRQRASDVPPVRQQKQSAQPWLRRWLLKLAAPLVMAGITIYGMHQYLSAQAIRQTEETAPILVERIVAGEDLASGTVIELQHLAVREVPESWLGMETYAPEEMDSVIGLQTRVDMLAGDLMQRSQLRRPVPNEFLGKLAPHRRAVTLSVSRTSSTQSHLQAGEMIDLYVTFEHKGQRITSLLLSSVCILQLVEQESESALTGVETITLDVDIKDAAKLVSAQLGGVLTAVQRAQHMGDQSAQSLSNKGQSLERYADHLAGFAGIDTSFDEAQLPAIVYGDMSGATQGNSP